MTTPALAAVRPAERLRDDRPPGEPAARPVLVAVALPRSGPLLVDVGATLAEAAESPVYALHLSRPPERGSLAGGGSAGEDHALAPALAHAAARGRPVRPIELVSRSPADDIREVARAKGAGVVVMGWHKPVWTRSVLGGTVHAVMRASVADVAVFIDRGLDWPPRRILVPYAGGRHDRAALRLAGRIVAHAGAAATVLHVVRPGGGSAPALEVPSGAVHVVESTSPIDAVLAEAAGHDLLVLGVGEDWALEPHAFGLRPERLVAEWPTSLLVVRGGARSDA
jgi:nucleotide-binding universal stress UspA family protein